MGSLLEMSGLCHSSELTLRSPQLITVDGLDTEGISGACWAGSFFIWHTVHCGEPAKKEQKALLAFRAAMPGAEAGLCFGVS